jgi:RNA polymerase sigma-70 factor (ECF subfamily)
MDADTETLLDRAAAGDESAVTQLLSKHRPRMRAMVRVRMDPRMIGRCDPSDIVQEALLDAHRQLPNYLAERPLPFYPWLRQITWQQLVAHHRRHLQYQVRSVLREEDVWRAMSDHSTSQLANHLIDSIASPSQQAARSESRREVLAALQDLSDTDREVLVLRVVEQLSSQETAAVLNITDNTVRVRQFRALKRLEAHLRRP